MEENEDAQKLGGQKQVSAKSTPEPSRWGPGAFARDLWFGIGYKVQMPPRGTGCSLLRGGHDKGLGISIKGLTSITEEMNLVNPFVRIHLVNIETGKYIRSTKRSNASCRPVSSHIAIRNETLSDDWIWKDRLVFDSTFSEAVSKEHIILFELLDIKSSLRALGVKHPEHNSTTNKKVKRIAWAFLLPVGGDGSKENPERLNVGSLSEWGSAANAITSQKSSRQSSRRGEKAAETTVEEEDDKLAESMAKSTVSSEGSHDIHLHLQLHAYRLDGMVESLQRGSLGWAAFSDNPALDTDAAYPYLIPEVYMQWRRRSHMELSSAMRVSLGPSPLNVDFEEDLQDTGGVDDVGNSVGAEVIEGRRRPVSPDKSLAQRNNKQYSRHITPKMQLEINTRRRTEIEECIVPDTLLHTLEVGPSGAMALSFAHGGVFLAAAGESPLTFFSPGSPVEDVRDTRVTNKIYSLHIFDVDTGKSVWSDLRAHHGIVYQTRWSLDDKWLLTCSADGSAKIWDTAGLMAAVTRPSSTNAKAFSTHLPYLQCALELSPPCFIYTAVFQDYSHKTPLTLTTSSSSVPRVIIGSNDGRIRVYQETSYIGQLGLKHEEDFHSLAPHSGSVNDLSVDCKSKNLFSADSVGTVLVWRLDTKGWYQILRKLKTDALGIQHVSSLSILSSLALSRALEPTKHSHDLLLLSPPSTVTVFNTSTYRSSNGAFAGLKLPQKGQDAIHGISRAALSADGRLAICGSSAPNSPVNIIRIWEVATGNSLHSPISSLSMPYPVRAIAWHPTQHVIAVAMVGAGAAVGVYYAKKASSTIRLDAGGDFIVHNVVDAEDDNGGERVEGEEETTRMRPRPPPEHKKPAVPPSPSTRLSRLQQARDILAKAGMHMSSPKQSRSRAKTKTSLN